MIRLYSEANGRLRFKGKNREAERLAAQAIRAEKRAFEERLHARHMAMLGETSKPIEGA